MIVSTRGRYALRVLIDLAGNADGEYISLKAVSDRQEISGKYLEAIVSLLAKGGLVKSRRGKEGGYMLARPSDAITVGEVLRLTEGRLAPVACLECGENVCERAAVCATLPMWTKLDDMIEGYLGGITIKDLIEGKV